MPTNLAYRVREKFGQRDQELKTEEERENGKEEQIKS
jgi:hypothetical protein